MQDDFDVDDVEFPEELDEFLEYCVAQHGNDFDAISNDFLEIAAELDEQLAERAHLVFTAARLRNRWALLCEAAGVTFVTFEDPSKPTPEAEEAIATPPVWEPPASPVHIHQAQSSAARSSLPEPAPSNFSVLTDDLKGQVGKIYQQVQNQLPSISDDEDSDLDVTNSARGKTLNSPAASLSDGSQPWLESDTEEARLRAIKLFGTDDLHHILSEETDFPAASSSTGMGTKARPSEDKNPNQDVSSGKGGVDAKGAGKGKSGKGKGKGGRSHDAAEEESSEHDSKSDSEDSLDEDFAKQRQAMKTNAMGFSPPARKEGIAAPVRDVPRPPAAPPVSSQKPPAAKTGTSALRPAAMGSNFVRLELIESSSEGDSEGSQADGADEKSSDDDAKQASGDSDGENEEDEPLRVANHLIARAPDGECNWDMWLSMLRRWPRLQVKVGSPEFFRRGTELRVKFDAAALAAAKVELEQQRQEAKERQLALKERMKQGAEEFIKEAEKRRAMMGSRMRGFLLTSNRPVDSDEEEDRRKAANEKKAAEAARAEAKAAEAAAAAAAAAEAAEREAAAAQQREAAEAKARQEAAARREERKAAFRASRLRSISEAAARHCLPLFDPTVSTGPPLPSVSKALGATHTTLSAFLVPWGAEGARPCSPPLREQIETISFLHSRGLLHGMMMLPTASLPQTLSGSITSAAALVVIADSGCSVWKNLQDEQLTSGTKFSEMSTRTIPLEEAQKLVSSPLKFWAGEPTSATEAGHSENQSETVCVVLRTPHYPSNSDLDKAALLTVVTSLQEMGVSVAGMRVIFPDERSAANAPSAGLRARVSFDRPALLLALRGPSALTIWRSILGPADPVLARRTDPMSLNARFGGETRSEALSPVPPSNAARAQADVVWAFGGRCQLDGIDSDDDVAADDDVDVHLQCLEASDPRRLPALALAPLQRVAVELRARVSFAKAASALSGMLVRLGHVVSLCGTPEGLRAVAEREGGGMFLSQCRLCDEPALGGGSRSSSTSTSRVEIPPARWTGLQAADEGSRSEIMETLECREVEVPSDLGLRVEGRLSAKADFLEEACRLGEPEVVVLGLRPQASVAAGSSLLQEVLLSLLDQFGTGRSSSIDVGGVVDLIGVRALDFSMINRQELPAGAAGALDSFRDYAQLVKRVSEEATRGWWSPSQPGRSPTIFLCLRGDSLISRLSQFFIKEWKLAPATGGEVLCTTTVMAARQAYRTLFGGLSSPSFAETVPRTNLGSLARFNPLEGPTLEDALFPNKISSDLTVAVLIPPKLDLALFRVLTSCEQQEFTLASAVMWGGLEERLARTIFEQEVSDGHLSDSDWSTFCQSVGCSQSSEPDANFKCISLALARPQAVKKLAQLCGHGDPSLNQQQLKASLRIGKDRIFNGVRCATSPEVAMKWLSSLSSSDRQVFAAPEKGGAPPRSLSIEESERFLECSLIVFALPPDIDLGLVRVIRQLQTSLGEQGLHTVGLVASDRVSLSNTASTVGLDLLEMNDRLLASLRSWGEHRLQHLSPLATTAGGGAEAVLELAGEGRVLVVACEGPVAVERGRQACSSTAAALHNEDPTSKHVLWYTSPTASDAAGDVAWMFPSLHGAKHHIV